MGVEERSPNSIYSAATDRSECSCCSCHCCCCCAHTPTYHRVSSLFSSLFFFPYRVDGLLLFHRIPENKTSEYQPTHTHADTRAHSTQHTAHSTAHTHKIKSIKKKNGAISIPRQARSAGRNPSRYRSRCLVMYYKVMVVIQWMLAKISAPPPDASSPSPTGAYWNIFRGFPK